MELEMQSGQMKKKRLTDYIASLEPIGVEHNESVEEEYHVDVALEVLYISSPVHIETGTVQRYQNKDIYVQESIHCEGRLEFDHCTLHYGELGKSGVIELDKTAVLDMQQCTIHRSANEDSYSRSGFIRQNFYDNEYGDRRKYTFRQCEFHNCYDFMCFGTPCTVVLEQCSIFNPYSYFIRSDKGNVIVRDCRFLYNREPTIGNSQNTGVSISSQKLSVSSCVFTSGMFADTESPLCEHLFEAEEMEVANCIFSDLENLFYSTTRDADHATVKQCKFENCQHIFCGYSYYDKRSITITIENCFFNHCARIGKNLSRDCTFSHCQFTNCYGSNLLESGSHGGLTISNCEFRNWDSHVTSNSFETTPKAMLVFNRDRDEGRRNDVQNCIFNGMQAGECFVMMADVTSKLDVFAVEVSQCQFSNCTSTRIDGKIIQEYGQYETLFSTKEQLLIRLVQCKGARGDEN